MKYLVMLGDGMADRPVDVLGGKTPLEAANKPNMDALAKDGKVGMAKTIPEGMPPGSDTANLSVMGYYPRSCYTGRSPLEAVSMGIELAEDDVTYRCNVVTLSDAENYEDADMVDYSSGEITTPESTELINYLAEKLNGDGWTLYPGISYRHCLVHSHAKTGAVLTPPHDISGKPIKEHLPKGENAEALLEFQKKSRELLKDHPANKARIAAGKNPAVSCWLWGEGTKPAIPNFKETFGVRGGVISAVDLIKGIGMCAGLDVAEVEGVTGNLDTNFDGKAAAAIELFEKGCEMVYIHVEAPDECGHHGDPEGKTRAIELIDEKILGPVLEYLKGQGEFRVLLAPDHPTPIEIRTHSSDPIPFVLYDSAKAGEAPAERYTEKLAEATGVYLDKGWELMGKLIKGE